MSLSRLTWPLGVSAVALVVWEAAVGALGIKAVVLPRPSAIAAVVLERWPLLLEHLWPTFYQILLGFALSVVGGLVMAVLVVYSERIRKGVLPLIVTSQIVPKVAVAPLLVVWFGTGDLSRLLLAFLIAFFPIVINTVVGLTSVDDDYIKMARAFMGTRWQIFAKIRLPHALPLIFGTLYSAAVALTIAVPLALGVAIFLTEFAPRWLRTPVATMVELLAGVPSVIYGLWGMYEQHAFLLPVPFLGG